MKRNSAPIFAITIVCLAIAGCKMNVEAELYSSDLRQVVSGTEGLTTSATLALPIASVDECEDSTSKIRAIMAGVVDDFTPKGCERQEMESFLMAEIQIPLVGSDTAWSTSNSLLGILGNEEENGSIRAFARLNVDKFSILKQRVRDEFFQDLELRESKFVIILNNDERGDITFSAQGVFVNGNPMPIISNQNHELKRRHRADIRLSNVAMAYLEKNGIAGGFTLHGESK